jgi:hypothetical protein
MFFKCLVRQESTICSLKALRHNPQKRCRYLQLRTISTSQYVNNNKQVEVVSEKKTEVLYPSMNHIEEENIYFFQKKSLSVHVLPKNNLLFHNYILNS